MRSVVALLWLVLNWPLSLVIVAEADIEVDLEPPNPILVNMVLDRSAARPRNVCVQNPFRDIAPEKAAVGLLKALRAQQFENLGPLVQGERLQRVLACEAQYPIQSWRLGDRTDATDSVTIMYWVRRGNDYPVEEQVWITVERSGAVWKPTAFAAVY